MSQRQRKITDERLKDAGAQAQVAALAVTSKTLKTPLPEELLQVELIGKEDPEAAVPSCGARGIRQDDASTPLLCEAESHQCSHSSLLRQHHTSTRDPETVTSLPHCILE